VRKSGKGNGRIERGVSENASQLVQAKKHLPNIAYSAIKNTFSALTFGFVFVARQQYSNAFILQMCDCRP
jgi:hypothetical protein